MDFLLLALLPLEHRHQLPPLFVDLMPQLCLVQVPLVQVPLVPEQILRQFLD